MALNLFKLEKLKIKSFDKKEREGTPPPDKVFEAMFNPASFTLTHAVVFDASAAKGSDSPTLEYNRTPPSTLTLDLVLDGTGVNELGVVALDRMSVKDRVDRLLAVTYNYEGKIHEPRYLIIEWGDSLKFKCRLSSLTIRYTAFDRSGNALRAEIRGEFISDDEVQRRASKKATTSPDLTHSRTVRAGDTLPLLTREIYGSADSYLDVARYNGLDDFRRLTPGQEILFPPLVALRGAPGKG